MKKSRIVIFTLVVAMGAIFGACEELFSNIDLRDSNVIMFSGEQFQIEAYSNSPLEYVADDEYYAWVSRTGLVTANCIGETTITLFNDDGDSRFVNIEIEPLSYLYYEPELEFGWSMNEIISKYGTPDEIYSESIVYSYYSNDIPVSIVYLFNSYNELDDVYLLMPYQYRDELGIFLGERYIFNSIDDYGTKYYINGLSENMSTLAIGSGVLDSGELFVNYFELNTNYQGASIARGVESITSRVKEMKVDLKK